MLELLSWLEGSALGETLRASGVWTYGVLNLGHITGIATLFGAVLLLDLRLVGLWSDIRLDTIARPGVPLAIVGFSLAAATGVCMVTVNATDYYGNPFLLIKFPAIALGLLNAFHVSRMPAWRNRAGREPSRRERCRLAIGGAFSLLCWSAALAAGRMIGYW